MNKGQAITWTIAALIGLYLIQKGVRVLWTTPQKGLRFEPLFRQASDKYGLPPGLLSKVAHAESRYNPEAVSSAGARGIMQFMPATAQIFKIDPFNPVQAIDAGAQYLRDLYNQFGDWSKALAAYNWGASRVRKASIQYREKWLSAAPTETRQYVTEIMKDTGLAA